MVHLDEEGDGMVLLTFGLMTSASVVTLDAPPHPHPPPPPPFLTTMVLDVVVVVDPSPQGMPSTYRFCTGRGGGKRTAHLLLEYWVLIKDKG